MSCGKPDKNILIVLVNGKNPFKKGNCIFIVFAQIISFGQAFVDLIHLEPQHFHALERIDGYLMKEKA